MQDYRKLDVWEQSHALTLSVYRHTKRFPKEERYGLVSQMRRASASVPSNIAEGCGRHSKGQLDHFLEIAAGSASELDYQLLLARDLQYVSSDDYRRLSGSLSSIRRMLTALMQKVGTNRRKRSPKTKN